MNLKIKTGTVGYNNKILVSDVKFSLGKNEQVDLTVPAIKSHKVTQTATNSNDVLLPHGSPHQISLTKNQFFFNFPQFLLSVYGRFSSSPSMVGLVSILWCQYPFRHHFLKNC